MIQIEYPDIAIKGKNYFLPSHGENISCILRTKLSAQESEDFLSLKWYYLIH